MDSILLEKNAKYDQNGLTVLSNNNVIVPRDTNGNVIVNLTSSLLVIEAIGVNVLNESVLPLVDTQFNYFRFPVTTTTIDTDIDLNIDVDLNIQEQINEAAAINVISPLPSEYKPSSDQRIPLGDWGNPSIIDFSTVVTGPDQIKPNSLVVTQELLDQLNALQTDTDTPILRITGRIKTSYNDNRNSAIGFSIGLKDSAIRFTMDEPAGDIKNSGNDIIKTKKKGVYTTNIDTSAGLSDLYVGQELQIRGWAEDSQDNRNHTIIANDSYIKFEAGVI